MQPIDVNTFITKGMPLSPNFLLDHVTTGAYHYVMGKWAPNFTVPLTSILDKSSPLWQVAANLQMGADGILEPLLKEFGNDLIIRSGLSPTNLGQSFDIQIAGFQGNMFNVMEDIQKLAKGATGLSMVQGATSFARIDFTPQSIINRFTKDLPDISSFDALKGISIPGLNQIQGFI